MATGYTHNVTADMSLERFVWQCARAFGALVTMRDDPADTPVPGRFEVSTYHLDALERAKNSLATVRRWTPEQSNEHQRKAREDAAASDVRLQAESDEKRNAYNAMLAKVMTWEPPTSEHVGLKDFMIEQLTKSREFDCHDWKRTSEPVLSAEAWKAKQIEIEQGAVDYHEREWAKEQERVNGRNAWVQALRDSFAAVGQR